MQEMTEDRAREIFLEVIKAHRPLVYEIHELAGICQCCDLTQIARLALTMHFCHSCQADLLDKMEKEIKDKYSPAFITRGHGSTVVEKGSLTLGFGWMFATEDNLVEQGQEANA